MELGQVVVGVCAVVVHNANMVRRDIYDNARLFGQHNIAGVDCRSPLAAGSYQRTLRTDKRNSLTLHVGAHQCSVSLIMLKERDKRCAHGNHLTRRNVHKVNLFDRNILCFFLIVSHKSVLSKESSLFVKLLICLSDNMVGFLICRHVYNFISYLTVNNLAIRSFDKSERINASECSQRADKTDVRTFRRLNRTHAAEVGRVNVSNFHGCAIAAQTAGTQRGKTALVCNSCQRIVLIHELRKLRCSEELFNRCRNRANVQKRLRRDCFGFLRGHAFADDSLHAGKTGAKLVLNQLSDLADSTVSEVIDIVNVNMQFDVFSVAAAGECFEAVMKGFEILHGRDNVLFCQRTVVCFDFQTELAVNLVASHASQIITLGIKVE